MDLRLGVVLLTLSACVTGVPLEKEGSHFWEDDLDDYFQTLIEDEDYDGGALGVLKNGRMVFARGYGIVGDRSVHPTTIMPISSLSKTLTAVAILQLAEQGYLGLEDEVFGEEGILQFVKPVQGLPQDPRIQDITIDHLLRHAAGWVETQAPVFDPMMNQVYLERGHEVVDIAKAMNVEGMLTQYDLIRFVITTPLAFTPGTRSSYSNFGYCVLGRVIEEVTGLSYEQYVAKHILIPAGMMHTRIGARFEDEEIMLQYSENDMINSQYIHSIVDPEFLDSTLGWYSNVYDMSRFVSCLMAYNGCRLLRTDSVQYMMEKPPLPDLIHDREWEGIALVTTDEGAVWQDSYKHDNDVIFLHKGAGRTKLFQNLALYDTYDAGKNVTIIAIMSNNRHKRLHKDTETIYDMVVDWPEQEMRDLVTEDITDVILAKDGTEVLFRYDLSEHHIQAYLNALKLAGYYPTWLNAYTWDGVSNFLVISRKATNKEDLDFQTVLAHEIKKVYKQVADWEEQGYYVSLLESYQSFSHLKDTMHLVVLRRTNGITPDDVLWNINVPLDEYYKDLEDAIKHSFSVAVQSVEHHGGESYVSYVFRRTDGSFQGPFLAFHDLSHDRLEELIKSNAMEEYHLQYLDAFRDGKQPMFSAVFRQAPANKWVLQTDIEPDELAEQVMKWHNLDYIPKFLVGYERHDHSNGFTGFFVKP